MAPVPGSNSLLERTFSRSDGQPVSRWSYYFPSVILAILGGPSLVLWAAPYVPWLFWTSLGVFAGSLAGFVFIPGRNIITRIMGLLTIVGATVFLGCFNSKYNTPFFSIAFLVLAGLALSLGIIFHVRSCMRARNADQFADEKAQEHKILGQNVV